MVCPTVIDAVIVCTLPRAPRAVVVAVVLPCACAQCCGTTAINYPTPKSFTVRGCRDTADLSPPSRMRPDSSDALDEA